MNGVELFRTEVVVLANGLAVANGKGGVGKTSLVANLAAIAAASGWRVLAVDIDMQGNLGMDLGYRQREQGDEGRRLLAAVRDGAILEPSMVGVRANLDVICAGSFTRQLEAYVAARRPDDPSLMEALGNCLLPIRDHYDLIVFDCPPSGASNLADLALGAARTLVVPVKSDEGSLDGLELMGTRVREARATTNPDLELLGVVLFDLAVNETAIRAEVEETLRDTFESRIRVFDPPIRRSARAARDMRRDGVVSIEYERLEEDDRRSRLKMLREGAGKLRGMGPAKSRSASGIADDYVAIADAVLQAFGAEPALAGHRTLAADPWA